MCSVAVLVATAKTLAEQGLLDISEWSCTLPQGLTALLFKTPQPFKRYSWAPEKNGVRVFLAKDTGEAHLIINVLASQLEVSHV
jgi:L-lactate utilization protein LutB